MFCKTVCARRYFNMLIHTGYFRYIEQFRHQLDEETKQWKLKVFFCIGKRQITHLTDVTVLLSFKLAI